MRKCEVIKDLLPLYIDKCCSEVSKQFVEEHLAECEECRYLYEEMCKDLEMQEKAEVKFREDEEIFKEGTDMIKNKVKKDIITILAKIDLVINMLLVMAIFIIRPGEELNYILEIFGTGALAAWSYLEFCYLFKEEHTTEMNVSRGYTMLSVSMKILAIVLWIIYWIIVRLV